MTPLQAMAWSADPLVREIAAEIDDRENEEIALAIHDLVFGADWQWKEDPDACENAFPRQLQTAAANLRLSLDASRDASALASQIIDWTNYGEAYGEFENPPWKSE